MLLVFSLILLALLPYAFQISPLQHQSRGTVWVSPQSGSDITSEVKRQELFKCKNQSECIAPELQLTVRYKVHLCKQISGGVRFHYLVREGLLLHPNVDLLEHTHWKDADYLIYLPSAAPWQQSECRDPTYRDRLLVLDEKDYPIVEPPPLNAVEYRAAYGEEQALWYHMLFKRSFVDRRDGIFQNFSSLLNTERNIYPITYAIAEGYLLPHRHRNLRDLDILCTLRSAFSTRSRVMSWVAEYGRTHRVRLIDKELDKTRRTELSRRYYEQMKRAKIIVTVNPADFEGDFRLWESLSSGALVLVDPLFVPYPHPLEHRKHVVFFDNTNKSDLFTKLDYYLKNEEEAKVIARNGYLYSMKYHRTVSMIDYVLRSAHVLASEIANIPHPQYTFTAQYLIREARRQEANIIRTNAPGVYVNDCALNEHSSTDSIAEAASDAYYGADHPLVSPREGSDISEGNQMHLLHCINQSRCIVPELQLRETFSVYLCKHVGTLGVRYHFLVREGLLLHPNVILLDSQHMLSADYVFLLPYSTIWEKTECNDPRLAEKLVILDEWDQPTVYSPPLNRDQYTAQYGSPTRRWYHMMFKRSFVHRFNGKFQNYSLMHDHGVYPITYAIAESYIPLTFRMDRPNEVLCTLRGNAAQTTRLRVQIWISEYARKRAPKKISSGQVDTQSRTSVSTAYFEKMSSSQIIVSVNPAHWEGDFRLWESLSSGALVFVDPLFVPHPYPLVHGEHVIFYDNSNRAELFRKLDYYRNHTDEARQIAMNGYLFAMKHHRTVNMIDYVLCSLHTHRAHMLGLPNPKYLYTAQFLNHRTKVQEEDIKRCNRPGLYDKHGESRLTC